MENKRRILFISRTMDQGGAEKVVYQLASDLKDRFEYIAVASTGGILGNELATNGIPQIIIKDIESKSISTIISNFKILKDVIKKNDINIIHSHHRMAAFYARALRYVFPSIALIYTAHNSFFDRKLLYNYSLRKTKVISVGQSVKDNLVRDIGIRENYIVVIPNSVKMNKEENISEDIELFEEKNHNIVCLARLSEQKGIKYLIDAMNIVKNEISDIRLFLIGDGEERKQLEELVSQLELNETIIFLGYKKNVIDYIKQSEFIVLSSLWEGFPLTPIETFMMGKTIIATNIPGTNEIVNNDNGMLVSKKDSLDLAKAINYLIKNPNERIAKEKQALQTYLENFSYNIFLDKHEKIYFEDDL